MGELKVSALSLRGIDDFQFTIFYFYLLMKICATCVPGVGVHPSTALRTASAVPCIGHPESSIEHQCRTPSHQSRATSHDGRTLRASVVQVVSPRSFRDHKAHRHILPTLEPGSLLWQLRIFLDSLPLTIDPRRMSIALCPLRLTFDGITGLTGVVLLYCLVG
jgi:hypothetical protein